MDASRALALALVFTLLLPGCGPKTPPRSGGDGSSDGGTDEVVVPTGPVEISFDDDEWDDEDQMSFLKETADCGDLYSLEPAAMLGTLTDPQISCLEDKLEVTEVQTFKKRLSLILIVDSWSSGESERLRWEALVRRHLDEFDRSDPDLCYKFARHLQKRGAEYGEEAVRWADIALENKTLWSGDTYVSRVYSLLKLKSMAAADVWQASETAFAADPGNDSLREERDNLRNEAKTIAREWLDYARESGKDPTSAYDLCVSAAGTDQYCS